MRKEVLEFDRLLDLVEEIVAKGKVSEDNFLEFANWLWCKAHERVGELGVRILLGYVAEQVLPKPDGILLLGDVGKMIEERKFRCPALVDFGV